MKRDITYEHQSKVLRLLSRLAIILKIESLNLSRREEIIAEFVSRFSKLDEFWSVVWQELGKVPATYKDDGSIGPELFLEVIRLSGECEERARLLHELLFLELKNIDGTKAHTKGAEGTNAVGNAQPSRDESQLRNLHYNALEILLSWASRDEKYRKYVEVIPAQVSTETLAELAQRCDESGLKWIRDSLALRLGDDETLGDKPKLLEPETFSSIAKALAESDLRDEAIRALENKIFLRETWSPLELSETAASLTTLGEILPTPDAFNRVGPYLVNARPELREAAVVGLEAHIAEHKELQAVLLKMLETEQDLSVVFEVFYALKRAELINAELSAKLLEDVGRLERWCFELLDEHHQLHVQTLQDLLEDLLEEAQTVPGVEAPSRNLLLSGKLVKHSPLYGLLLRAEAVQGLRRSEGELSDLLEDDSEENRQSALFCIQLEPPSLRRKLLGRYTSDDAHPLAQDAREILFSTRWEEDYAREQNAAQWIRRWCAGLTIPALASGVASFCALKVKKNRGLCSVVAYQLMRNSLHKNCVRQVIMRETFSQFSEERGLVASPLSALYREAHLDIAEIFNELL